jgi:hypothetical protein
MGYKCLLRENGEDDGECKSECSTVNERFLKNPEVDVDVDADYCAVRGYLRVRIQQVCGIIFWWWHAVGLFRSGGAMRPIDIVGQLPGFPR